MLAFLTVASLHFLAMVSPGPDFVMVVKNSLTYSRRTAILTALGIAIGIWVHVFYCIMGLGLVIANSVILFNLVKLAGAGYLIWVGLQALFSRSAAADISKDKAERDMTPAKALLQGLLCNVLNPKATLFFLSLFTLVVKPTTPLSVQWLYGLEMFLATFIYFAAVGSMLTRNSVRAKVQRFQRAIEKVTGGVMVAFGIKLALSEQRN